MATVERYCSADPDSFEQYQGCIDNVTAEDVAGYDTPAAKAAIEAVQDPSENYPVP